MSGSIFIYSIVSIKLLLRYNAITEVYTLLSTGQIIPFIIGIASLWKVVWKILMLQVEESIQSKMESAEVATSENGHEFAPIDSPSGLECQGIRDVVIGEDNIMRDTRSVVPRAATM
jgi:hypothetical protein